MNTTVPQIPRSGSPAGVRGEAPAGRWSRVGRNIVVQLGAEAGGFDGELLEAAAESGSAAPRVLTYSSRDVIDQRISVPAQHSLVRLSKNPATSADAVGLLAEVKTGRLAGIYCVNWLPAAQRALKLGASWGTVIPRGEDAMLLFDPGDVTSGSPLIAYRRELDPGCGLLRGERKFPASPARLDAALLKAWATYRQHQGGQLPACEPPGSGRSNVTNQVPQQLCLPTGGARGIPGRCGVPRLARRAQTMESKTGTCPPLKSCKPPAAKCVPVDLRRPKLCLHLLPENDCDGRALFFGMADRWAGLSGAMNLDVPPARAAIPFRGGDDIVAILNVAGANLAPKKIAEVHLFGHMFVEGILGATDDFDGLYRDRVVEFRSADLDACVKQRATERCGRRLHCKVTRFPLDLKGGAATVADIPLEPLADDVVFVLHGCNTASTDPCRVVSSRRENFAAALCRHLGARLHSAKVYGHSTSTCAGANRTWVEYSAGRCGSPKVVTRVATRPVYHDLGNLCCT